MRIFIKRAEKVYLVETFRFSLFEKNAFHIQKQVLRYHIVKFAGLVIYAMLYEGHARFYLKKIKAVCFAKI